MCPEDRLRGLAVDRQRETTKPSREAAELALVHRVSGG
jgi:hypothetical protein